MANADQDALARVLEYAGQLPGLKLKRFIADEVSTPRLPRATESSTLPTERLISAQVGVTRENDIPESHLKAKLVHELAEGLFHRERVDLERIEQHHERRIEYRMSAYVFTREQMISFIRDVEDAVKEQLAQ